MSKQGKPQIRECSYCGVVAEVSKDHVIPRCLFRQPYPPNLITVKACYECHNAKSLNDDFLRDMLTVDIYGIQSPIAKAIFLEKVLSSARQGSSDLARSFAAKAHIEPIYSNGGIYLGDATVVHLDENRVTNVFSTIVRGLYYDARKQRLPIDYVYQVRRYHPFEYQAVWDQFKKLSLNGPRILGDVFGCVFASAQEDPFTSYWLLWFYERILVTVWAGNPAFEDIYTVAA
jgi:hypothetical protein